MMVYENPDSEDSGNGSDDSMDRERNKYIKPKEAAPDSEAGYLGSFLGTIKQNYVPQV